MYAPDLTRPAINGANGRGGAMALLAAISTLIKNVAMPIWKICLKRATCGK
jgi:hypothetical protein